MVKHFGWLRKKTFNLSGKFVRKVGGVKRESG